MGMSGAAWRASSVPTHLPEYSVAAVQAASANHACLSTSELAHPSIPMLRCLGETLIAWIGLRARRLRELTLVEEAREQGWDREVQRHACIVAS